ncbi:MAG: hypothetical protein WCO06_07060, partial [Candidatus Roizmanbacteria bacterium]
VEYKKSIYFYKDQIKKEDLNFTGKLLRKYIEIQMKNIFEQYKNKIHEFNEEDFYKFVNRKTIEVVSTKLNLTTTSLSFKSK